MNPRKAYKKEKIRLVGLEIDLPELPFIPERTPIPCPICGGSAWAYLRRDVKEKVYDSLCLSNPCRPIQELIVIVKPIKVKQK